MDPATLTVLALIAKVGIPAAVDIINVIRTKGNPTLDDWANELTRINKTYDSYIDDATKAMGK